MSNILPYRDREADLRGKRQRWRNMVPRLLVVLLLSLTLNTATCYVFINFLCVPDWGICEAVCLGVATLATVVFVVVVLIHPPRTWPKVIVFAMASALPVVLMAAWIFTSQREASYRGLQMELRELFGTIPKSLQDYHMLLSSTVPEDVWSFHLSDGEVRELMINGWRMQRVTRTTLPDKADLLADPKYLTLGGDEQLYWVAMNPSDIGEVRTLIWSPSRHACLFRQQRFLGPPGNLHDLRSNRKLELKAEQEKGASPTSRK